MRRYREDERRVGQHLAPHPSWPADVPPGSVILGTTPKGKKIWLPPEMRKLGLHVVGLPNQGKSKLLECTAWQDTLALCGTLCSVIFGDPHGTTADALYNKSVTFGIDRLRTIRYLNISDPDYVFKLNPTKRRAGIDPAVPAAAATDAVLKAAWGRSGQDPDAQPQLSETLNIAFYTVVEFGGAFVDAAKLLELDDSSGLRAFAAEHSENPMVRSFWRTVEVHKAREREALLGSARRRLVRFLLPRRAREIFGSTEGVDWRRVLDDAEVVFLNLAFDEAGIVSEQQAVTVGTLILHDIHLACRGRKPDDFTAYLYWDEVHRYATEAAARLCTEARKFKLHPIYAHQFFEQLDETGPFIKGAIMSIRNKVLFGGLPPDEAELAARFAYRGNFETEKVKHVFDRPVAVDYVPEWLRSESVSEGTAVADGSSWSEGGSEAHSHSTTRTVGFTAGVSATRSAAATRSTGVMRGTSDTDSSSETESRARTRSSSHTDQRSAGASWGATSSSQTGTSQSSAQAVDCDGNPIGRSIETVGSSAGEGSATSRGGSSQRACADSTGEAETSGAASTTGRARTMSIAATSGRAATEGRAHTTSSSVSESFAETFGTTVSRDWSTGGSTTHTRSEGRTTGRTQTLRSVLQVMPSTGYTLPELIEETAAHIAYLKPGQAIVKIGHRPAAKIRTLRVKDGWARPEHIARAKARLAATTAYIEAVARPAGASLPAPNMAPTALPAKPNESGEIEHKEPGDDWG